MEKAAAIKIDATLDTARAIVGVSGHAGVTHIHMWTHNDGSARLVGRQAKCHGPEPPPVHGALGPQAVEDLLDRGMEDR